LLQAPLVIVGHQWISAAALLGTLLGIFNQATVVITILADGTHWVVNAWVLDIMGFLVGFFLLFNTGNHQIERLTAFGT
jgi:hypothetical protein